MLPDSVLYSGGFDLKDAFYQFELPLHLRPYFCLPDCPASFCPSLAARGHTMVTPRLRVIPMGWSHALNVCQELSGWDLFGTLLEHRENFWMIIGRRGRYRGLLFHAMSTT